MLIGDTPLVRAAGRVGRLVLISIGRPVSSDVAAPWRGRGVGVSRVSGSSELLELAGGVCGLVAAPPSTD